MELWEGSIGAKHDTGDGLMLDEHDVRRIAMALPGVTEEDGSCYFRVNGDAIAWPWRERVHPKKPKVERRDIFVVQVEDENEKAALVEGEPDRFFTEPHYDGYAMVLVRLAAVDEPRLAELLADAREIVIERAKTKRSRR
jgi:hypothetical protein